jgi:hypothetical protein
MTFIEALEMQVALSDFAVLTLTPDDQLESRGQTSMAPRDNVLFELGLFMGRLGRERTYFVCDKKHDLKLPTDLLGVHPANYERREGQDLVEAVAGACALIAARMSELGVRPKHTPEVELENRLRRRFCDGIVGTWWGRQWSQQETRLSLLRVTWDHWGTGVQLDGETFDMRGRLFGRWKSVAIGVRVKERNLFFSWEGTHPTLSPGDSFKGFGQYTFEEATGAYDRGEGLFADLQIGRKKAAVWKSVELRRVDMADLNRVAEVMRNGADSARAAEMTKAVDRFTGSGGQVT